MSITDSLFEIEQAPEQVQTPVTGPALDLNYFPESDPLQIPKQGTGYYVQAPEQEITPLSTDVYDSDNDLKKVVDFHIESTRQISADNALKAKHISDTTGIPYKYAQDNLDVLLKEGAKDGFNLDSFVKNNPASARWLAANPDYAPFLREHHKDATLLESGISVLKSIERGRLSLAKAAGSFVEASGGGHNDLAYWKAQSEKSIWFRQIGARETYEKLKTQDDLETMLSETLPAMAGMPLIDKPDHQGWLQKTQEYLGRSISPFGTNIRRHYDAKLKENIVQDKFHTDPSMTFFDKLKERPIETIFVTAGEQTANIATVIGSAVLAKKIGINPYVGAFGTSYVLEAGDILSESMDSLLDRYGWQSNIPKEMLERAHYIAEQHGTFNAALDALVPGHQVARSIIAKKGIKKLMSKDGMKYLGKQGVMDLLKEVSTEIVQEESTMQALEKITGKKFSLDDRMNRYAQAAIGSGVHTGAFSTLSARSQIRLAQDAIERKDMFEALSGELSKSKINDAPEVVKGIVDEVAKNGATENIGVPAKEWQEYYQSKNLDPVKEAEKAGISQQEYAMAIAHGFDLVIKTSTYASEIAVTDHGAALAQDVRFVPGEMTGREGHAYIKEVLEPTAQEKTATQDETKITQLQSSVVEKLVNAGYSREEAEVNASLHGIQGILSRGGDSASKVVEEYYDNLLVNKGVDQKQAKDKKGKAAKTPVNKLTIDVEKIEAKTGEVVIVKQNAEKALQEMDKSIFTLNEILKCLK